MKDALLLTQCCREENSRFHSAYLSNHQSLNCQVGAFLSNLWPMYSYCPRSRPRSTKEECCYPFVTVTTVKDVFNFSNTEIQFLHWIQEWEKRIFSSNKTILQTKSNCRYYSCNVDKMDRMETYFKSYQNDDSNVLGQDRFVWSVFANALIKKHKYQTHENAECSSRLCFFLLLWSSYYLRLPSSKQVQELLREIIFCTRSLRFLFSFLPGMSMTSYISGFLSKKCDENILCDEFFFSIEEDFTSSRFRVSLYQCYSPLLFYFVSNLTSLHQFPRFGCDFRNLFDKEKSSFTLLDLLDKPVVDQNKQETFLTLAIQHKDEALVKLLLQMGASADTKIWDPVTEDNVDAEQLLVSSVNSLVASKYFFSQFGHTTISSVMEKIDSVTVYAHMMQRSLLCPSLRKADNVWRGEGWRQELNSEIADRWGVDYKRPFPSLQHITKISIRRHILHMDRKLLPIAIGELPLPNLLKSYLNLTLD